METTGTLQRVISTADELLVEFAIPKSNVDKLDAISDALLDIKCVKHREKRSLNANAYFHLLCGKIANAEGISLTEVKNQMIAWAGEFDTDDKGNITHIILTDDINYLKLEWVHLVPTQKTQTMSNGKLYRVYLVRRGSHTYNTQEMSRLIDATVEEAKRYGIETLTPAELDRMMKMWKGES